MDKKLQLTCKHGVPFLSCVPCTTKENMIRLLRREEQRQGASLETNSMKLLDQVFRDTTLSVSCKDDLFGMPALCLVSSIGHEEGVKKLIQAGGDVNCTVPTDKNSPLILATQGRYIELIKLLITAGANLAHCNSDGNNAFMVAVSTGDAHPVNLLWQYRANFNINQENIRGYTAIHLAAERLWESCVNMLICGGADKQWQTYDGSTALIIAAKKGDKKTIERLLAASTSVDIEDNECATALCYAIRDKKSDLIELLMKTLFFCKDDKESYVRRRIDLLRVKSTGTITKEEFFESILLPVIQELCKHQECRDILFRIRAMYQLIPFLDKYLTNEDVSQKTSIILCMLMYVYTSNPDARFVDQFINSKGHELVLRSLYFYDASSNYDHKVVLVAFMPIISIYATQEGRDWLKKNYYKLSQYATLFETGCDVTSYLDCCKSKFLTTWQRFKWQFNKTSQEQAELVCAELLENEEKEKARERAKKEKRREKRKNRKLQQRAEREYAGQFVETGDDSLFDEAGNISPDSQARNLPQKGNVIADFLSGVQQKVKGFLGKVPQSPPRAHGDNAEDNLQRGQEQHSKKKRRKKNKPKRNEEDEVLLNHCAINPVFDRIQYSPKVIKSRTTKVPKLPRVEDILEPCENVSGDAPEVSGTMATPARVGLDCGNLHLPCLVALPETDNHEGFTHPEEIKPVPINTSSPVSSQNGPCSTNINENAGGNDDESDPSLKIPLDDVTEDSVAGLSPIGTPRDNDMDCSLTSSPRTPEHYENSPRTKHGKHVVKFKEMTYDSPGPYAFSTCCESPHLNKMSPRGRAATWAEITKKDTTRSRSWGANLRYGGACLVPSKQSPSVPFQGNDVHSPIQRAKKIKRPPRFRIPQDTKIDIISPTQDNRLQTCSKDTEGKPVIQKVNLRDMKIPLASFINFSHLDVDAFANEGIDNQFSPLTMGNYPVNGNAPANVEDSRPCKAVEVSCHHITQDASKVSLDDDVDVDAMADDTEYVKMQVEALKNYNKVYSHQDYTDDGHTMTSELSEADCTSENSADKRDESLSSDADMEVQKILQDDVNKRGVVKHIGHATDFELRCIAPSVCFYDFGSKCRRDVYGETPGQAKRNQGTNYLTDIRIENIPISPEVEFARLTPDPDDGFSNLDNTEYIYYPGMDNKMLNVRGLFHNTANNRFHKLLQLQFEATKEEKPKTELTSYGKFYASQIRKKNSTPPIGGNLWSAENNRLGKLTTVGMPTKNMSECPEESRIPWIPKSQRWRGALHELTLLPSDMQKKVGSITLCTENQRFCLTTSDHSSATSFLGVLEDGTEVAIRRTSLDDYLHLKKHLGAMLYPSIKHECLAKYLTTAEDESHGYLAAELCEHNLEEYIQLMRARNEYDFRVAKRIVWQLLKGLQYLHETCHLAQRTLKPQNILLDLLGKVRLSDYNISRMTETGQTILYDKGVGSNCWRPKECVTSGQAWTGTASVVSYTSKSDIQVAGMLVHYILTGGVHPYGDNTFDIELNIARGWPRWRRINEEANDLIRWMLSNEEKERPNITQALRHPFFWPELKRLDFLHTVGKEILGEFQYGPTSSSIISERLNNVSFQAVSRDWMSQIDEDLLDEMQSLRCYKNNVADFLRFIVNCQTQYQNLSSTNKSILGEDRLYFLRTFPALFMSVYRVVKSSEWSTKLSFSNYF